MFVRRCRSIACVANTVPDGIAVDLLFAAQPFTGLEHHGLHILRGLHRVGASVDVLVPSDVVRHMGDALDGHRVISFAPVPRWARLGREQWSLPWRFGSAPRGLRLLHSVAGVAPLLSSVPLVRAAYELLPPDLADDSALVFVGRTNRGAERLAHELRRPGTRGHVLSVDYVPRDQLPAIYSGAAIFVYPSRYEGFGLPVLEAMSCGAPVIVSSAEALSELVGDAGVVLRSESVEELTQSMERLLRFDDEARRLHAA